MRSLLFLISLGLFFVCTQWSVAAVRDSAGHKVALGDRILMHGSGGDIRKISQLTEHPNDTFDLVAVHPTYGSYGDTVRLFGVSHDRGSNFYKSIQAPASGPQIGQAVTMYLLQIKSTLELLKLFRAGTIW